MSILRPKIITSTFSSKKKNSKKGNKQVFKLSDDDENESDQSIQGTRIKVIKTTHKIIYRKMRKAKISQLTK